MANWARGQSERKVDLHSIADDSTTLFEDLPIMSLPAESMMASRVAPFFEFLARSAPIWEGQFSVTFQCVSAISKTLRNRTNDGS